MADDLGGNATHLALEDKAGAGRGGRGGRRGGGGRGGGRPQDRNMLVSKALSRLLRHQAENAGVKLDEGGWAKVDEVLAYGPIRSLKVSLPDVRSVIENSDKTRFALKPDPATNPALDETSEDPSHYLIRANQGHSIKLDSAALLTPITAAAGNIPATVFHGTFLAVWPAIEASGGLKRMGRNHVHFATALPEETKKEVSGMRRDAEVLVHVDVEAALKEGIEWWISDNGVVLTEGDKEGVVPSRFFKEVVGRAAAVGVLWKDGVKVADIPEGIKGRTPPGRRGGRGRGRGGA
ncbi:hypothetical protein VD0004_g8706 [Verticillium dahliae]|uniref:2'-phosphotransferase n=1 Tax=Verticillium dahliae TaxID=27337 RepID=A0A444S2B8_VERDA|nr:hypothetical protein VD0004_g8706 [Verticillium dahliae]PNH64973.1 hypothetical protein VD0001_g8655 [Verticillium dahliae]RXG47557.1 hypothetical protein VDGE_06499 [Verticillium dahliae]